MSMLESHPVLYPVAGRRDACEEANHDSLALMCIDPGSGSLIIQAVIAAVIAIPIFLRSQMGRIRPHAPALG